VQRRPQEAVMVDYLLNGLSAAEREQIERRFFQEPAHFEELQAVEEELVDDYARGAMNPAQHERFEREWLISLERRKRVDIAKAVIVILREATQQVPSASIASVPAHIHPRPAWFPWALAAVAIIAAVGTLSLVWERSRLRDDLIGIRQERGRLEQANQELERELANARARNNDLDEQLRRARERRSPSQADVSPRTPDSLTIAFVLPPGLTRSASDENRLLLPKAAAAVRLQVDVTDDLERQGYRAVLRVPEGGDVWSQDVLAAHRPGARVRVAVTIPAAALPDGDYILTLQAYSPTGDVEDVSSRAFRILRK
jgi:hypothetical protein